MTKEQMLELAKKVTNDNEIWEQYIKENMNNIGETDEGYIYFKNEENVPEEIKRILKEYNEELDLLDF